MKAFKYFSGFVVGLLLSAVAVADSNIVNIRMLNLLQDPMISSWTKSVSETYWPMKGVIVSNVQRLDGSTTFEIQFKALETNDGCVIMAAVGGIEDNTAIDVVIEGTTCPIPLPAVTGSN